MITFSKFLATIKIDVPIKLDMKALVREEPNEEELRKIFEEMEFRTLIDRVLKKSNEMCIRDSPAGAFGQIAWNVPRETKEFNKRIKNTDYEQRNSC